MKSWDVNQSGRFRLACVSFVQLMTVFSSHTPLHVWIGIPDCLIISDLLISGDELSATGFIPKVLKNPSDSHRAWEVPDFPSMTDNHLWYICIIIVIMIHLWSSIYIYCAYIYIYVLHNAYFNSTRLWCKAWRFEVEGWDKNLSLTMSSRGS